MAAAPDTKNYFKAIVHATEKYFGPASERFIKRQIDFHLNKNPESIDLSDVKKLKDSVGAALGILVDDKDLVAQVIADIDAIE
jgi:hypothetical protein